MKGMLHSKVLLLADENVPTELIGRLYRVGYNIKRAQLNAKDKQIFELAKSEGRVLLTFDKHFLNNVKFPSKESAGVIFIEIHPPLIDSLHFSLEKLFKNIEPLEFKGKLFILSATGFKVFPKE